MHIIILFICFICFPNHVCCCLRCRTDMAFVTLTSELAVTAICSGFLSAEAGTLIASLAPSSEDIIWKNVTISHDSRYLRSWFWGLVYLVVGLCWGVLLSFLSTVGAASGEVLVKWGVDPHGFLFLLIMRYLPVTLQLGILALVPILIQFTGTQFEGLQSNSALQSVIFSRYFLFQLMNIFVTIGSVSVFTFFNQYSASDIPSLLVETFPQVGAYFIEFILIKTMFGLAWELSRAWPCIQMLFARCYTDRRQWTKRSMQSAYLNCPELLYGWVYPSVLSVMVIAMTYAVVTPFVSIFSCLFFVVAEVVYKNNALYVYHTFADSGGTMWNAVVRRMVAGLVFSHVLLACYMLAKGAYWQQAVFWVLVFVDILFLDYCHRMYERPSTVVPLGVASMKDQADARREDRTCQFSYQVFEQPALRMEAVVEEPFDPLASHPLSIADEVLPPLGSSNQRGDGRSPMTPGSSSDCDLPQPSPESPRFRSRGGRGPLRSGTGDADRENGDWVE